MMREVDVRICAGFRTPALTREPRPDATGVRKAPRHEIAVGGALRCSGLYGDLTKSSGREELRLKRPMRRFWLESVCVRGGATLCAKSWRCECRAIEQHDARVGAAG